MMDSWHSGLLLNASDEYTVMRGCHRGKWIAISMMPRLFDLLQSNSSGATAYTLRQWVGTLAKEARTVLVIFA